MFSSSTLSKRNLSQLGVKICELQQHPYLFYQEKKLLFWILKGVISWVGAWDLGSHAFKHGPNEKEVGLASVWTERKSKVQKRPLNARGGSSNSNFHDWNCKWRIHGGGEGETNKSCCYFFLHIQVWGYIIMFTAWSSWKKKAYISKLRRGLSYSSHLSYCMISRFSYV